MSAFNNARYNLSEFNRKSESSIWIGSSLAEKVNFVAASSATVYFQFEGNELIRSELQGSRGLIKPVENAVENVNSNLTACSYFNFAFTEEIETDSSFEISFHAFMDFDMLENAGCLLLHSANNHFSFEMAENAYPGEDIYSGEDEEIHWTIPLSQFVYSGSDGTEVIDGSASVESYDEYICDLSSITLKPGQTLVIDAGNYDVLLNKKNAIHYQSGDWLDELNRTTKMIKIVADYPKNLSATILFTERYL